jgi:hypothetical protein
MGPGSSRSDSLGWVRKGRREGRRGEGGGGGGGPGY